MGRITLDAHTSRPLLDFDDVKRWVPRGKIFDSSIVDVETSDRPTHGASSFGPEVCLQSVDEYVRSTHDIDISSFWQNHPVQCWDVREPDQSYGTIKRHIAQDLCLYSAQQLSSSMSFRKEVATSLIDSVIVGNTCTVSMMSSIVSLYLTARTASWIISAASSARM